MYTVKYTYVFLNCNLFINLIKKPLKIYIIESLLFVDLNMHVLLNKHTDADAR